MAQKFGGKYSLDCNTQTNNCFNGICRNGAAFNNTHTPTGNEIYRSNDSTALYLGPPLLCVPFFVMNRM